MPGQDALSLRTDISQRTRWYVFVRWFFLVAIAVPGILSLYLAEGWSLNVQRDMYLAGGALLSNGAFYFMSRFKAGTSYYKYLALAWIIVDTLLISYLIFLKGGIESRSPILYAIPILMSAAIFGRRAIYATALTCATLYSGLIVTDYLGIIHSIGALNPDLRTDLPYVINSVCFFTAILLVIALAVDFITKLLITKQRQASEHLKAMMRAQEIAKLGSWEWDMKTDHITWSKELYKLFGVKENSTALDYNTYLDLVHPDDVTILQKNITNSLKKKLPFAVEHRIILSDGSTRYIHSEGLPTLGPGGKPIKMSGTAQDVTETYSLDVTKREFVSLASHQLRTPASGVKAFLSLLLDGYGGELSKKQLGFIRQAYESNNRQLDIIENLLSLATIESGKISAQKELVDVNLLVRQCLPNHRPALRAQRQKLILTINKSKLLVRVDPNHLQMALDNLISNAIKYTPEQGRIVISTSATGRSAYIEVSDSGLGIARKDLPALFQKFSRIDNPASKTVSGSGLGLYLAKSLIRHNKGNITVRSRPGKGTQFRIRLPLVRSKTVQLSQT